MIEVTLTPSELFVSSHVGCLRHISSIQRKLPNIVAGSKDDWNSDVDGASAEMAVAKHLGVYWNQSVNAGKAPDVLEYQIRSTSHRNGCLIIRERDKVDATYILVITNPPIFKIIGSIHSTIAKQDKYWRKADDMGVGAWWVPQCDLGEFKHG